MNTYNENTIAKNDYIVNTSVTLMWEQDRPFEKRPFFVRTVVNYSTVFHAFFETNAEAIAEAHKLHDCYVQIHNDSQEA